jgi:xylulokinase
MTAVPNLNWFIDQFGAEEKQAAAAASKNVFELCDEAIQGIPPGSSGVVYHPYLAGETGPFLDPTARASFFGISQSHTRKHLLRAVYEGVGYSIRHNFAKLQTLTTLRHDFDSVVVVGGGSRSNIWCQIIADIMEKKVVRCKEVESGCVGAAMAGGIAIKAFSSFNEAASKFVRLTDEYSPNRENARVYSRCFDVYSGLIGSYKPHWNELET